MSSAHRDPAPGRRSPFERVGLWVIVICGVMALTVLAWAASLPDGIVGD